ncbi:Carboxymuconolactone decarboxylase family protein [Corynebacterium kalinowskii]|uniref:Carboxymuconolactone decarboxylase family protein n=1 Tax=Corynebacterium kalinowskii TaxID=2675216 RepID=A0A6B8VT98_9CORY|nr:carboxymuconolactone decarboxylase family protein [Corynebacterium kalinowskii]QGU03171.1 Carboxymuconolactone decarboxylase family protein [Corynebacterium kalinowskii]
MKPGRPYLDKTHPEMYKTLNGLSRQAKDAAISAGLDTALIELIKLRCSQINACVTCLSLHVPEARRVGISETKINVLPAWRQADVFSPRERACLQIAEAVTITDPNRDWDAEFAAYGAALSDQEIAAAEWIAIVINSYNRLSLLSAHPAL